MTLGTTFSMGGTTPNVNNEIGQANTQTVSIGDRAVRNLANVAATGAISTSSLQNKGQAAQLGIAAFSSIGLRVYGWIDAGGWGALSATLPNAFGADPRLLDTRGTTNPVFMVGTGIGNFVYGTFITTGTSYSATFSRSTTGNFNNGVRAITFIGISSPNGAEFYLYANPNVNGFFSIFYYPGLGTPQLGTIAAAFRVYWVESGGSGSGSAYFTRLDSSTQKIGSISGLVNNATPTISYFSAQGTDTYYGLANSASVIFAAGGTGLAQAWISGGATKFAAPTTQVVGPGICRVNTAGNVVFYANGTSPYVHAWSFTASAFGAKFANPATLLTDTNPADQIYVHPSDKAVCFIISGKPRIYAWNNVTGFGALFTNPTEINAVNSVAAFFNRSF